MALRSAPFLLLVLVMVALQESCFGSSLHSLKYFYTAISDPSQEQPQFIAVGYVDGQVFVRYDSNSWRMEPQVSWMEKVGKEDPKYWDRNTQAVRRHEEVFKEGLETLRSRYNQSEGLHTLQRMYGCELQRDGTKEGFDKRGYEGETFSTFDPETLTWVALNPQITQRKCDADSVYNKRKKVYLEETCIEWLKKYLSYKMETLQRTETPKVTVRRTELEDGMEMQVCRVDGFYPKEIDVSWTRDGEVWLQDTLRGFVAPNSDGTYHCWLSIQIDPKERDHYRCHVEHDGLQEPLDLELKEPTDSKSNLGLIIIIICIVAPLVLVFLIAGILAFIYFRKRCQGAYEAALTSSRGTNSSAQALCPTSITESNISDQERPQDGDEAAPTSNRRSSSSDQERRQGDNEAAPTSNRGSSSPDQALPLTSNTESNTSNQERPQDGDEAAPTSNRGSSSSDEGGIQTFSSLLAGDTPRTIEE